MASRSNYSNIHNKKLSKENPGIIYDKSKTISVMNVNHFEDDEKRLWIQVVPKSYHSLEEASSMEVYRKDILLKRIETQQFIPEEFSDYTKSIVKEEEKEKYIEDLFYKFIRGTNITEIEKSILDNNLHIDDTLLSSWVDIGDNLELRQKGIDMLSNSVKGSWLIRKSSVVESDTIIPRVISFKSYDNNIYHHLIAKVPGFGYITFTDVRNALMPSETDENPRFVNVFNIYASFIDLIKHESQNLGFCLDFMIKNVDKQ